MIFMTRFNDLTFSEKQDKKARFDKLAEEIDANVTGDSTIAGKVEALETTVGKASGDGAGGLAKDVADIKVAIGSATGDNPSGLAHDVDDLGDYIAEILTANSLTDPRANQGGDG